ncbi:MAG: hypothetical protein HY332_09285 [Chloroflexi bacterium]|nr:hypothetical protein [Chloroflexota bacterium]
MGARNDQDTSEPPPITCPFVPWDALADETLDPQIRPLVVALNRSGWARTVFSCAGHPEEPDSVERGRRQAHVDVAVSDLGRWRHFVRACKRLVPACVSTNIAGVRHVNLKCVEGSLGPIPEWLRPHLPSLGMKSEHTAKDESWWRRLIGRLGGADRAGWHYRRLVFEPFPYKAAPEAIRIALDAALAAALKALVLVENEEGPQVT